MNVARAERGDVVSEVINTPARSVPEPSGSGLATTPHRSSANVLLVEDNEVNLDLMTRLLQRMGIRVTQATDGATAVELATSEQFDFILMDCELPVMDGFSATRRIREIEASASASSGQRARIFALTAHDVSEVRQKCMAAGMDFILHKPLDKQQIATALQPCLPGHESDPSPQVSAGRASAIIDMRQIDYIRAIGRKGGDSVLVHAVGKLEATTPPLLETIRANAETGNTEALWRSIHSLKSSVSALGAAELAKLCHEIERAARDSKTIPTDGLLDCLETELSKVTLALRTLIETLP